MMSDKNCLGCDHFNEGLGVCIQSFEPIANPDEFFCEDFSYLEGTSAQESFISKSMKISKLEGHIAKMDQLMEGLLNRVNRVTCPVRHGNPVTERDLQALCKRQVFVEGSLKQLRNEL